MYVIRIFLSCFDPTVVYYHKYLFTCCGDVERNIITKNAYSNIFKILPPKHENFQMKNSGSFHISAQNIDCNLCF